MDPEIFDHSLFRIQSGEATLSEVLREHQEDAKSLEPLLQTALAAHEELKPAGPTQDFRTNSMKRVLNLIRAQSRQSQSKAIRRPRWSWKPAYTLASLLIAITLLAGSFGVAYASGEALPGDTLYGVKRGLERVSLAFSTSAAGDSRLLLQHAESRLAEVQQLIELKRQEHLGAALSAYEDTVAQALENAGSNLEALGDLDDALEKHQQVLQEVMENAPEQALPGLSRALEHSQQGKKIVDQILQGADPSEIAPGQLRKTPDAEENPSDLPPGQLRRTPDAPTDIPSGQLKKTATPDE
jgi:tetratricopeptide (TPR) repeat protein